MSFAYVIFELTTLPTVVNFEANHLKENTVVQQAFIFRMAA